MNDLHLKRIILISAIGIALVAILVLVLGRSYPVGVDWQFTYHPALHLWQDPYGATLFVNPPYAMLGLAYALLMPIEYSNALNLLLNIIVVLAVIRRFHGKREMIFFIMTSPYFLEIARTNNIDWLPLIGFLLPAQWAIPFLLIKPQVGSFAILAWFKQSGYNVRLFIPLAVIVASSIAFYGVWFLRTQGLPDNSFFWNIAPFPYLVPVGIFLLFKAWKEPEADKQTVLAALSTFFFTPYVAVYGIVSYLALCSGYYEREVRFAWVFAWVHFIYQAHRQLGMSA